MNYKNIELREYFVLATVMQKNHKIYSVYAESEEMAAEMVEKNKDGFKIIDNDIETQYETFKIKAVS